MRPLLGRFCRTAQAVLPLAGVTLLAGCGMSDQIELRGWMDSVKQAARVTTQPVPPQQEFNPFVYDSGGAIEPFDPQKMVPHRQWNSGPLQPNLQRPREPLEDFPLDQIRMVGTIKGGSIVALLKVNGSTLKAQDGNHIGQNFGVVETKRFLKEIVQDGAGEWVERPAKLVLQTS